ncbi:MAG: type I-B CRISPR-associated protein Cas5 [Desulfobacterales bacterium]|nr:type I-B CRISPR-associated protein Cas5 [Desulfobacterales bacterium]
MNIDKILIFDIFGQFAHFRKFYTNASSLSYGIPPRTVIVGIINAIIGNQKDSYYEEFDSDKARIGIALKNRYRKIMQTVNYIKTDKEGWNFAGNPQQVQVEILVPYDDELKYRIYFYHTDSEIIKILKAKLENKRCVYNPYLGISEFLADIEYIQEANNIKTVKNKKLIPIITCFKKNYLTRFELKDKKYIIERMPVNFGKNRLLKEFDDYIYEESCSPVCGDFVENVQIYEIIYNNCSENIIFME